MQSVPLYARLLKPLLPQSALQPVPARLLALPVHLAVIGAASVAIAKEWVPWQVIPLLSLAIGLSFAGLMFLAHETLHGSVVRNQSVRNLVGRIAFLPFLLSPRLWCAWHNRVHHSHTNRADHDPDAYPTFDAYQSKRSVRVANAFAPGGGNWLKLLIPLSIGFSFHSLHVLVCARRWGYMDAREHRIACLETGAAALFWIGVAWFVGFASFLWVFVLPLVVANTIVMAFILTNHTLNPLTNQNDALLNTLSVRLPRALEWLTLNFGYHVEHHIFPTMSSRHAPAVRSLLQKHWPGRYQTMPLTHALKQLCHTARVYKDANTLLDPATGREWPTLTPSP
jgi:fatty acid desaturase